MEHGGVAGGRTRRWVWWWCVTTEERLQWEAFAQLPHGVAQIRDRLVTQDNIPLLVHLFTHA